jgi:hypothetical protein
VLFASAIMTPFNVEEAAEEVGNFKSDTLSIFKILPLMMMIMPY